MSGVGANTFGQVQLSLQPMNATCPTCGGMISAADSLCPECLKRVALKEVIHFDEGEAADVNDLLPESAQIKPGNSATVPNIFNGQGGERWGDYELIEPIGRGAMGTVFKARHTRLNRLVALK